MRLFVDLDVEPRPPERPGGRHATHPGADDCNFGGCHTCCRSLDVEGPFLKVPGPSRSWAPPGRHAVMIPPYIASYPGSIGSRYECLCDNGRACLRTGP